VSTVWLTFHGSAQTVTGIRLLVEHDGQRVLVDCGLFQDHGSYVDATGPGFRFHQPR
jgi:metallo-beta-lactamase family protein